MTTTMKNIFTLTFATVFMAAAMMFFVVPAQALTVNFPNNCPTQNGNGSIQCSDSYWCGSTCQAMPEGTAPRDAINCSSCTNVCLTTFPNDCGANGCQEDNNSCAPVNRAQICDPGVAGPNATGTRICGDCATGYLNCLVAPTYDCQATSDPSCPAPKIYNPCTGACTDPYIIDAAAVPPAGAVPQIADININGSIAVLGDANTIFGTSYQRSGGWQWDTGMGSTSDAFRITSAGTGDLLVLNTDGSMVFGNDVPLGYVAAFGLPVTMAFVDEGANFVSYEFYKNVTDAAFGGGVGMITTIENTLGVAIGGMYGMMNIMQGEAATTNMGSYFLANDLNTGISIASGNQPEVAGFAVDISQSVVTGAMQNIYGFFANVYGPDSALLTGEQVYGGKFYANGGETSYGGWFSARGATNNNYGIWVDQGKVFVNDNIEADDFCITGVGGYCLSSVGGGLWSQSGSDIYYNTGAVGIGTATPTAGYVLDLSGELLVESQVATAGAVDGGGIRIKSFSTNSSDNGIASIFLESLSGTPDAPLDTKPYSYLGQIYGEGNIAGKTYRTAAIRFRHYNSVMDANNFRGIIEFQTTSNGASSPTTKMTLSTSGQLILSKSGIYVVDGPSNFYRSSGGNAVGIHNTNSGTNTVALNLYLKPATPGSGNHWISFYSNGASSSCGAIEGNGVGGINYGTCSDERLKENIVDYSGGLSTVLSMKVRNFNYIGHDGGNPSIGFVAQELYEVHPNVVGVGGENVVKDAWQIDYGKLTPVLASAIQELAVIVDTTLRMAPDGGVMIPADLVAEGNIWGGGSGWISCIEDMVCACPEGMYTTAVWNQGEAIECHEL